LRSRENLECFRPISWSSLREPSAWVAAPIRYRRLLEAAGAEIPPDQDERHVPRARFHAQLARDFGPAEAVEPMYLRVPDADKTIT